MVNGIENGIDNDDIVVVKSTKLLIHDELNELTYADEPAIISIILFSASNKGTKELFLPKYAPKFSSRAIALLMPLLQ